jgi:hypothetical protein
MELQSCWASSTVRPCRADSGKPAAARSGQGRRFGALWSVFSSPF